jgi:protein-tyrosine kinase
MKVQNMNARASTAETFPGPRAATPSGANGATGAIHEDAIGAILRRTKGLNAEQVDKALLYQRENGGRVGQAFVALGLAEPGDIVWALSQQFHYPYAPFATARVNEELVVANDPFSEKVEAFRDLRTQLVMGALAPELPRAALAVVSANVGDGKSFVAANLAVAFSQLSGRTLLVDGDLRTPRLHHVFGIDGGSGLATLLSARVDDHAIRTVPNLPNLFVLPVGVVPPNPTELIQRSSFPLLMKELLLKFDYVVVDTPAAEHGSDARVLAARCGAALAIGRRNHSHTVALKKLLGQMEKASVRIAGVMVNEH